jgi:multisubunit Na+/H+ antiporter MnhE subunit
MIHALALLGGLVCLWLALAGGPANTELIYGGMAALSVVMLLSWRLGLIDAEAAPYPRALALARLMLAQAPHRIAQALRVARAALAADVTLSPALVRVRLTKQGETHAAAFGLAASAAPGMALVELEGETALLHVVREDDVDPDEVRALERST